MRRGFVWISASYTAVIFNQNDREEPLLLLAKKATVELSCSFRDRGNGVIFCGIKRKLTTTVNNNVCSYDTKKVSLSIIPKIEWVLR
jgi:hypothetical protein